MISLKFLNDYRLLNQSTVCTSEITWVLSSKLRFNPDRKSFVKGKQCEVGACLIVLSQLVRCFKQFLDISGCRTA